MVRFSAVELRRFFFKPLELHLELADLLKKLRLPRGRFGHAWRCLRREDLRQAFEHLLFPLAYLHWMHLVLGGYQMHRLYAFKRFQPYLGFELGTELTSVFLGHVLDRFSGLDLTIPPVQFSDPTSQMSMRDSLRADTRNSPLIAPCLANSITAIFSPHN